MYSQLQLFLLFRLIVQRYCISNYCNWWWVSTLYYCNSYSRSQIV